MSEPPEEYLNYLLCSKFGWTYDELQKQPASFVSEMLIIMNAEKKINKWQTSK
jgi:hypothetical protein